MRIIWKVTGQNVDKPKRRQPKRRQTETSTTKTLTNRNVDRPKRQHTETSTDWNVDIPYQWDLMYAFFIISGMYCICVSAYT